MTIKVNPEISPKDNFYSFVNSKWCDEHPVPENKTSSSVYNVLDHRNDMMIQKWILELGSKGEAGSPSENAISTLYRVAVDAERREKEGIAPVKQYIDEIMTISDWDSYLNVMGKWMLMGMSTIYGVKPMPDLFDNNKKSTALYPSMTFIGAKELYFDEKGVERVSMLKDFMGSLYKAFGIEDADKLMAWAMELDYKIAQASPSAKPFDPEEFAKGLMTLDEADKKYPNLRISRQLNAFGYPEREKIYIMSMEYFSEMDKVLSSVTPQQMAAHLLTKVMMMSCAYLTEELRDLSFGYFSKYLNGIEKKKENWELAVNIINCFMGEEIGKMYVGRCFPSESKLKAEELTENIRAAFRRKLQSVEWMSEQTRENALRKLEAMTTKVGYPESYKKDDIPSVDSSLCFYQNVLNLIRRDNEKSISEYTDPYDKTRWPHNPQTINACYRPNVNEMCFPAGILQEPFFSADRPDALNYGAIGVVMGHEMSHAFDNNGRKMDASGTCRDWWSEEDAREFERRSQRLSEQFSSIEVLPGVFADGQRTLGENIADQCGIMIAYQAMKEAYKGRENEMYEGYTPDQLFFIGYASCWASNIRKEALAGRVYRDTHSLPWDRVNCTLMNIDAFAECFDIQPGDGMYRKPEARIIVW